MPIVHLPQLLSLGMLAGAAIAGAVDARSMGPLRICAENPRYFARPDGTAVYLTGCHTWANFKDMGHTDPPPAFDYAGYLDKLLAYGHNFVRLWTWELTRYGYVETVMVEPYWATPFPWPRTGPGEALDGKPKFDLSRFDQAYFDRLRERVIAARTRGIYVSVMLFEGHGVAHSVAPWRWDGHPFNVANNINGINGDPDGDGLGTEIHALRVPEVTAVQEAYARKVIETVNDLDNVLYEICNEAGGEYSTPWQYHFIDFIHQVEQQMPHQHPVGMTFQYPGGSNPTLFASRAEWISPNPEGGYSDAPPAADGTKVIISDTDHLWGIGGNVAWVWKTFARGMNPIFMDPWDSRTEGLEPEWEPVRANLGYTRRYALRMNLNRAVPHGELSSTGYCLADPGRQYLVYAPEGGQVILDLTAAPASRQFSVEWLDLASGATTVGEPVAGGCKRTLPAPWAGGAVVYLRVQ